MSGERALYRAAGVAAIVVLAIFPLQMSVFALAWPPPATAEAYFGLLQESWAVGLLSLDVLLMVDWLVLVVLWMGLHQALRGRAPWTMGLAFVAILLATAMYFASNTAVEMLTLSQRHAEAATEAERAALLAAGEAALASFEGTAFTVGYVLAGLATVAASAVMWRAPGFGRIVGGVGVAYGLLQLAPPNLGAGGMAVSLASLVPMLVWLALVARAMLRLARQEGRPLGRGAQAIA